MTNGAPLSVDKDGAEAVLASATAFLQANKWDEALAAFGEVLRLRPRHAHALFANALCLKNLGRYDEAIQNFERLLDQPLQTEAAIEIARTYVLMGNRAGASAALTQNGLSPAHLLSTPDTIPDLAARLDPQVAMDLLSALRNVESGPAMAAFGKALWRIRDPHIAGVLSEYLPDFLLAAQDRDAGQIYLECLKTQPALKDFRPRYDHSPFHTRQPDVAAEIHALDRARYDSAVAAAENAHIWKPAASPDGTTILRAVTSASLDAPSLAIKTKSAKNAKLLPVSATPHGSRTLYTASADLLPGSYEYALMNRDQAVTSTHEFTVSGVDAAPAETVPASNIGTDGATFTGRVAALAPGARVRFEYGATATDLSAATPWEKVAPPRTGHFFQPLYRQRGDWVPMVTRPGWGFPQPVPAGTGFGAMDITASRPRLNLGDIFSRDRNQLNGIGSHEMPVGFAWSDSLESRPHPRVAGGSVDLRDAEISFVVSGQVNQKGAACHFWISHRDADEISEFSCQWALTATPFPDTSLEDGRWHKVKFHLPNDPSVWTYTGNNPAEQQERAMRYRRRPLNANLSRNNQPHVLIFAFGDERDPPTGTMMLSSAALRYRNYSLLSPAFGAELAAWPEESAQDPLALTDGSRGLEDRLWVSGPAPRGPMVFRWRLQQPTTLTHIQINQHPYYPAKSAEVIATDESGAMRTLWSGDLPEAHVTQDGPDHLHVALEQPVIANELTLRILSGYSDKRWGLDSFEVYGADAPYMPDGQSCSVSCDVTGLVPGTRVYYRVVLEDGDETLNGEILPLDLPPTAAPLIESAAPLVRTASPPAYFVRANAMGAETEMWGELTLPSGEKRLSKRLYLGCQPTARHAHYFPDHTEEREGRMRLIAKNNFGETALDVAWPIV